MLQCDWHRSSFSIFGLVFRIDIACTRTRLRRFALKFKMHFDNLPTFTSRHFEFTIQHDQGRSVFQLGEG